MDRLSNEMYPHIVERVAKLAPWDVKLAFRLTSKHFLKIVDSDIYYHVKVLPRLTRRLSRYPPAPEKDSVDSDSDNPSSVTGNVITEDWPLKDLVLAEGRTGRELPAYPKPGSKRWSAPFKYARVVDVHCTGEWLSNRAEEVLETSHGLSVLWVRRSCPVSVTLAATHVVDLVHIAKDTESWNVESEWFEELVVDTPRMSADDSEDGYLDAPFSPVLDHIVNIEFDPFYNNLHFRPVCFERGSGDSNDGTFLWVCFLASEEINVDSSRLKTAENLEDSFVWNVLLGFIFMDYAECTLVGLEKIPPQLLGLPHDTEADDINGLVSHNIESNIKRGLKCGDYDAKFEWFLDFVQCRSLAELERDSYFKKLIPYQSTWTGRYLKEYEYNRSARNE